MDSEERHGPLLGGEITRRRLLELGAQGMATLAGVEAIAAFGSSPSANAAASASVGKLTSLPGGKPVRGGTVRLGFVGSGVAETISPWAEVGIPVDICRQYQLFDRLFALAPGGVVPTPSLAVAAESNKTGSLWTLHIRDGVKWHDGKPLTVADVVYSIKSWQNGKVNYGAATLAGVIDYGAVRSRGPLTVDIPLHVNMAEFLSLLTQVNFAVVQNGTKPSDFAKPVGTGPFMFKSFTPGQQSVFVRNPDYWQHGKPYFDEVVIDSSFSDPTSRINAQLAGTTDMTPDLDFSLGREVMSSGQATLLQALGANYYILPMRCDLAPFSDVRVRQALKLLTNREQMVETVLNGFGAVANDLLGFECAYFDSSLKSEYDVDKAKSLLKAAGQSGLTVQLKTSPSQPGLTESAAVFAQQAAAAGVKVNIKTIPPANYYTQAGGYLSNAFMADYTFPFPSLTFIYRDFFVPGAPYGETHYATAYPSEAKLTAQAMASTSPSQASELWTSLQKLQFERGGLIVWGAANTLDSYSPKLRGLATSAWSLNEYRILDGWFG
jgi:peptide/nickel transport system substrate-binding protein